MRPIFLLIFSSAAMKLSSLWAVRLHSMLQNIANCGGDLVFLKELELLSHVKFLLLNKSPTCMRKMLASLILNYPKEKAPVKGADLIGVLEPGLNLWKLLWL